MSEAMRTAVYMLAQHLWAVVRVVLLLALFVSACEWLAGCASGRQLHVFSLFPNCESRLVLCRTDTWQCGCAAVVPGEIELEKPKGEGAVQ